MCEKAHSLHFQVEHSTKSDICMHEKNIGIGILPIYITQQMAIKHICKLMHKIYNLNTKMIKRFVIDVMIKNTYVASNAMLFVMKEGG